MDEDDPQKFNGDGLSVSLCKGRKRRVYDSAIQMEIDAKQKEIDRIKYLADRRDQFTDEFAPSYWRVNLRRDALMAITGKNTSWGDMRGGGKRSPQGLSHQSRGEGSPQAQTIKQRICSMTSQQRIHGLEQRVALLEAMLRENTVQISELIELSSQKTKSSVTLIDVVNELKRAN